MVSLTSVSIVHVPDIIGVDFFCGAGGTTHGFLAAGIDILCGVDWDQTARRTYEANNKRVCGTQCKFFYADITDFSTTTLEKEIGDRNGKALVFIACAPCQPFTSMNTEKANQGNKKNLLSVFMKYVEHVLPEFIVVENVPGIRLAKYGDVFDKFICDLDRLGYHRDEGILDAKKYGVPQTRKRMAVIASRLAPIKLPDVTHGKGKSPYNPAEKALRFPAIAAGETHTSVPNHQASSLSELNVERIRAITCPGGSRREWPAELQLECYRNHDGHEDVYGRINPKHPAPTLTTKFHSISNGRFGHPTEDRAISAREGAALQTFPDDYVFHSTFYGNTKHIGNAVPVLLAKVLGEAIVSHYREYMRASATPNS